MRVGHFWGPLQGALSQFIDIQGFDPLTTGMSQRLRQPCLFVLCPPKSQGVPQPRTPPLRGCHGEQISPAGSTMSHSCGHILSFFLFFFSSSDFVSCCFTEGPAKESFLSTYNAWCVMDIPIHVQCNEEQALKIQRLPFWKCMATDIFPLCWGICCFIAKDMSVQVVNRHCSRPSPNTRQSYFIQQLGRGVVAPVMPHYYLELPLVCLWNTVKVKLIKVTDKSKNLSTEINFFFTFRSAYVPHNLTVSSDGKQLTDVWHCDVLLSHKYVPRANVKEIRLKGKLQLYLTVELASGCSQVMGHVCASPYLNLKAAAVGTVITEVRHKSQSKTSEREGAREGGERK